jgi:hypothetical protein
MNLLTQVFRSYWLASVHNSQISSLQRFSFFTWRDSPNNWFLASWLAGLFGLTARMLKLFSSWVRDRWSPTRSAAPEYMYPIVFRHSYNHSRKTSSQELLMFKIIANSLIKKNTHTHIRWKIEFWRKPTFSIPFILVSSLSLPTRRFGDDWSQQLPPPWPWKKLLHQLGGKARQNKTNLRQFWKNLCHNFTIYNRVGNGGCHSFFFAPHTLFLVQILCFDIPCCCCCYCWIPSKDQCLGRY